MPTRIGSGRRRPVADLHYPVTPRFWRGVWNTEPQASGPPSGLPLRRACDWKAPKVKCDPRNWCSLKPTCADCIAYVAALIRMGKLRAR